MKKICFCLLTLIMFVSLVMPCFATGDNPLDGLSGKEITINQDKVTIPGLTDGNPTTTGQQNFWSRILTKYKSVIVGVAAVCTLTFVLIFVLNFTKLGQSAGNPQMRSQAIMGLIVSGIALACTGGIGLFFGFFYNALNGG